MQSEIVAMIIPMIAWNLGAFLSGFAVRSLVDGDLRTGVPVLIIGGVCMFAASHQLWLWLTR